MNQLIQDTLQKIKAKNITPVARWKYVVKKYSFWCAFLAVVILGAVSFSVALYSLSQLDWDLYRFVHQNPFIYALSLLPYFWLILIGAFLFLAFFDLRKTEDGYRFSWLKMSFLSIGSIVLLGFVFSLTSLAGNLNSLLIKDVPYYGQHMLMTKESQWMQPDKGFLAGSIHSVSKNDISLKDLHQKEWIVSIDQNTFIRPSVNISPGQMIKIIGTKKGGSNFQAKEIRPWAGRQLTQGQKQSLSGKNGLHN